MTTFSLITKNTNRGKVMHAAQAKMSNAKSDDLVEWEARAMTRRPKYKRNMAILFNIGCQRKKENRKIVVCCSRIPYQTRSKPIDMSVLSVSRVYQGNLHLQHRLFTHLIYQTRSNWLVNQVAKPKRTCPTMLFGSCKFVKDEAERKDNIDNLHHSEMVEIPPWYRCERKRGVR